MMIPHAISYAMAAALAFTSTASFAQPPIEALRAGVSLSFDHAARPRTIAFGLVGPASVPGESWTVNEVQQRVTPLLKYDFQSTEITVDQALSLNDKHKSSALPYIVGGVAAAVGVLYFLSRAAAKDIGENVADQQGQDFQDGVEDHYNCDVIVAGVCASGDG